jgi:hypothetical protein
MEQQRDEATPCAHCGATSSPGISWQRDRRKWRVRLKVGTRRMQVGYYPTRADALAAYQRAVALLADVKAARSTPSG